MSIRSAAKAIIIKDDQIPLLPEIRPQGLQQVLPQILANEAPVYLGTEFLDWEQD